MVIIVIIVLFHDWLSLLRLLLSLVRCLYVACFPLFQISASSMQLLNNPNKEDSTFVKLHFEMRLEASNYDHNVIMLHEAAQDISTSILNSNFKFQLILALDNVSLSVDNIDYSRYGWMISSDIDIINAMAVPIGNVRAPFDVPIDSGTVLPNPSTNYSNAILAVIAMTGIVGTTVLLLLYWRLKQENYALARERSVGGSLRQMWTKFADQAKRIGRRSGVRGSSSGTYRGDRSYLETDNIQMTGFRPDLDDQVEDGEYR